MKVYPNYDNLPWHATHPFRMQAAASAEKTGNPDALFVFRGTEFDFQPANRLTQNCLYLIESISFLPSIPDDVIGEALVSDIQLTISKKADAMNPAFPDTIPLAGRCDYLPLRWWFAANKEPDGLTLSMNAILKSVPGLIGRESVSFRVALNGYEVNDKAWAQAFLQGQEWESRSQVSDDPTGVSMIVGRPSSTLSQWGP